MNAGTSFVLFALGAASCSPTPQYPKTFDIQVRGNIGHVVFDLVHGPSRPSQRNCVERIRVYAIDAGPVAPSSGDDLEAVRAGIRWETQARHQPQCLGSLPLEYGEAGAGRVRVSAKRLRLGSSYGVAIRLKDEVVGSARFQIMPNGSIRSISLEEFMRSTAPHAGN